jgi:hypothetical protein
MMIGVLGLGCAGAHAQKPPPPQIVSPGDARPSILRNQLDMSLCEYPPKAQREQLEGCCRMKVVIGTDGKAGRMSGECTDDIFYGPSQSCLAPQTYVPARKKGKPVKATGEIVVEYRLYAPATPPLSAFLRGLFPTLKKSLRRLRRRMTSARSGRMISSPRLIACAAASSSHPAA